MPSAAQLAVRARGAVRRRGSLRGDSACRCVSFWSSAPQSFIHGYFNLFHIGRYPEAYSAAFPVHLTAGADHPRLERAGENPRAAFESPWISLSILALATGDRACRDPGALAA